MRKILTTTFIVLLSFIHSFAQDSTNLTPQYPSIPYYVKNGKLVSFEKVKARNDAKVGMSNIKSYLTVFSKESSIRFQKGKIPKLLIKIDVDGDPSDYLSIIKSEKARGKRKFSQSMMSHSGKAKDVSSYEIKFDLIKIRNNIYELLIDDNIESGEYAVISTTQSDANSLFS